MKPPSPLLSTPLGVLVLWVLALWAMALSIDSWLRPAGSILTRPLPPRRLVIDGLVYAREAKPEQSRASKEFPSAAILVRHWLVSYRRLPSSAAVPDRASTANRSSNPSSQPPLAFDLAMIEGTGSGRANRLPIKRVRQWMKDSGIKGSNGCLLSQANGQIQLITNPTAWDRAQAERRSSSKLAIIPAWLLGLRGIEDVSCLWLNTEDRLSAPVLRQMGSMAKREQLLP